MDDLEIKDVNDDEKFRNMTVGEIIDKYPVAFLTLCDPHSNKNVRGMIALEKNTDVPANLFVPFMNEILRKDPIKFMEIIETTILQAMKTASSYTDHSDKSVDDFQDLAQTSFRDFWVAIKEYLPIINMGMTFLEVFEKQGEDVSRTTTHHVLSKVYQTEVEKDAKLLVNKLKQKLQ